MGIKKLFVRAQWAKAMANLGFNEACVAYYASDDDDGDGVDVYLPEKPIFNSDLEGGAFTAPTYQQAVDWFKEKHKIEILIINAASGHHYEGYLKKFPEGYIIEVVSPPKGYKIRDYYAVLNQSIMQTIWLIK